MDNKCIKIKDFETFSKALVAELTGTGHYTVRTHEGVNDCRQYFLFLEVNAMSLKHPRIFSVFFDDLYVDDMTNAIHIDSYGTKLFIAPGAEIDNYLIVNKHNFLQIEKIAQNIVHRLTAIEVNETLA